MGGPEGALPDGFGSVAEFRDAFQPERGFAEPPSAEEVFAKVMAAHPEARMDPGDAGVSADFHRIITNLREGKDPSAR